MNKQEIVDEVETWLDMHDDEGSVKFSTIDNVTSLTLLCDDMNED